MVYRGRDREVPLAVKPRGLLQPCGRLWEGEVFYDGVGLEVDERQEGCVRLIGVGDCQQTLSHGHLVRAIYAVGIDREETLMRHQTEHLYLAVAVAGPDLVPHGKDPFRTHAAKVEGVAASFPGKVLWLAYFPHIGSRAVIGEGDLVAGWRSPADTVVPEQWPRGRSTSALWEHLGR